MNSGCLGRLANDNLSVNCSYREGTPGGMKLLNSVPEIGQDETTLVGTNSWRTDAISLSNFVATPLPSNPNESHFAANMPATMEPPETLEIRVNFRSSPKSF